MPQAGPTDSPGQVAAGWTSLFPASLCNQVMQGQLACLHKGRPGQPQLGRGKLLKGLVSPESPLQGPVPTHGGEPYKLWPIPYSSAPSLPSLLLLLLMLFLVTLFFPRRHKAHTLLLTLG